MKTQLRQCLVLFAALAVITGLLYPLFVTGVTRVCFPHQAGGSLIMRDGVVVGSELLAQKFSGDRYFHPRPSAGDYATLASGASNLGPTSKALKDAMFERAQALRKENHLPADASLPADLLQTSGSGLDPDISPEAARLQVERVAAARRFTVARRTALEALVQTEILPPQWHLLGEPRVNVLRLNMALDRGHF